MRPACDRCGSREAIHTVHRTNENLCGECLVQDIRRRVFSLLDRLVEDGDRVAVALSGGKDSSLALYLLAEYQRAERRKFGLMAITVDEGTAYRRSSIEAARELTRRLGVEHVVVGMRDIHGIDVAEIRAILPRRWRRSACTYCGVLRRWAINRVAREEGATKVATGHNLDDVLQTHLMNLARGDVPAMARSGQGVRSPSPLMVPRIRPLAEVREREVAAAALYLGLSTHFGKCPLTTGMRVGVRRSIDELELAIPGIKEDLLSGLWDLIGEVRASGAIGVELRSCKLCGEPTTGEICKTCQMKLELQELAHRPLLFPRHPPS